VKEHPILMGAPMVRAILDGRKSQTRRVMKPQLKAHFTTDVDYWTSGKHSGELGKPPLTTPYGQPGDRLWVRETWAPRGVHCLPGGKLETMIAYRADGATHLFPHHEIAREPFDWKPSIFMPRWASRITLEITAVRVERVQDISEADAKAEGIESIDFDGEVFFKNYGFKANAKGHTIKAFGRATQSYESLWEKINGAGSWADNPFVWVISFRRIP
jgi:hypothetical protein